LTISFLGYLESLPNHQTIIYWIPNHKTIIFGGMVTFMVNPAPPFWQIQGEELPKSASAPGLTALQFKSLGIFCAPFVSRSIAESPGKRDAATG
jgi:hypothetical protein